MGYCDLVSSNLSFLGLGIVVVRNITSKGFESDGGHIEMWALVLRRFLPFANLAKEERP